MNFLKAFGRWFASFFLPIFLLSTVGSLVWLNSFGNKNNVKDWFEKSGIYTDAPKLLEQELSKAPAREGGGRIDPVVIDKLQEAFSPGVIKEHTTTFIDGIYNWLEGKTNKPDFKIDLSPAVNHFLNLVGDYARQQAVGLPKCTRNNLPPPDADILSIECLPPGTDVESAIKKWQSEFLTSGEGKNIDTVLTSEDLAKDGRSPFDQLAWAPGVYKTAKIGPLVFAILSIASGALMVWLHDDKKHAWNLIARRLLVVGALVLAGAILASLLITTLASKAAAGSAGDIAASFAKAATGDIAPVQFIMSTVFIAGGITILVLVKRAGSTKAKR